MVDQDVQSYIKTLLSYPLFVDLDWSQVKNLQIDEYQSINLPAEPAEHKEGVFRMNSITMTVWSSNPINISVYREAEVRVIRENVTFKGREECEQNALEFLKIAFPQFFKQSPLPTPSVGGPDKNGIWHFRWQRYREDELPDTNISASVRAIDGKVVEF